MSEALGTSGQECRFRVHCAPIPVGSDMRELHRETDRIAVLGDHKFGPDAGNE